MKYQDEIEAVRQAAKRAAETKDDLYDRAIMAGVEMALVWAQGNGTSDTMKDLERDAAWRQEVESVIPSNVLREGRDLLGPPSDLADVNPEYQRAVLEMVSRIAGLDTDSSEIVAELLGLDHDTVYPRP